MAQLGHDRIGEVSFSLKFEILSVSDNDAWFEIHSSLVGGAFRGFENRALIPFFCYIPNPEVVSKSHFMLK